MSKFRKLMNPSYRKQRAEMGFTLIELLVVIAIIGILAIAVILALVNARRRAQEVKVKELVNNCAKAQEVWMDDNQSYGPAADIQDLAGDPVLPVNYAASGNFAVNVEDGTADAYRVEGFGYDGRAIYECDQEGCRTPAAP